MGNQVAVFDYTTKSGKLYGYRFEIASIDGQRKWSTGRGFTKKSDAAKAGRDAQLEYERHGTPIEPSDMSYADLLDKWLKSMEGINKATTQENYKKKIDLYIKPNIGGYRLKSIKKEDVRELLKKLSKEGCVTIDRGLSRNTMLVIKGIITNSFDFAVDERFLTVSPASGRLRLPKKEDNFVEAQKAENPHVFITQDRITQIFERFDESSPSHIPLMFGYKCGMRIGEAFAVCWEDIDLEKKTITINRQVQWHKNERTKEQRNNPIKRVPRHSDNPAGYWYFSFPKYKSIRTIEIDDDLVELLKKEKKQQEKDEAYYGEDYFIYYLDSNGAIRGKNESSKLQRIHPVCVRRDGEYINPRTMQHVSSVIHNQLGFPEFDFHSLRHTHASMLAERGAAPMYVKNRLGHKNLAVTLKVYYHYTDMMAENGTSILQNMY